MMSHCPITGVCLKRFVLILIAGFAFCYGVDYLVNAHLLMGLYDQTPQLWRSETSMQQVFWSIPVTQMLIVLLTALIYTRNHEGKGVMEGVRFGAMIGALLGVKMAQSYIYLPISLDLAMAWFVVEFVRGLGLGVIYALLYRK